MTPARRPRAGGRAKTQTGVQRPPLPDEIHLKRARALSLVTTGRRTGKTHRVELWFVHVGGRLHLMAYARRHGRGTDWYQNLRRARQALVEVGVRRYEVAWEKIEDPSAALARITDLFSGKYGRQMVASYYLETKRHPVILRVTPLRA